MSKTVNTQPPGIRFRKRDHLEGQREAFDDAKMRKAREKRAELVAAAEPFEAWRPPIDTDLYVTPVEFAVKQMKSTKDSTKGGTSYSLTFAIADETAVDKKGKSIHGKEFKEFFSVWPPRGDGSDNTIDAARLKSIFMVAAGGDEDARDKIDDEDNWGELLMGLCDPDNPMRFRAQNRRRTWVAEKGKNKGEEQSRENLIILEEVAWDGEGGDAEEAPAAKKAAAKDYDLEEEEDEDEEADLAPDDDDDDDEEEEAPPPPPKKKKLARK